MHWVVTYFIRSIGCLSVEADGGTTGEKYIPSTSEDPIWLPVFFSIIILQLCFVALPAQMENIHQIMFGIWILP